MVEQTYFPDKSLLKDSGGRYLTQSLFLEFQYNTQYAVYTLDDQDKEYEGKLYPSLKRLYLETMDPTGYEFANRYLFNYEQWTRICANKQLYAEIEQWELELEVKIRSIGVRRVLAMGVDNFSAAKWAVDGHWNAKRGRPSKKEQEREREIRQRVADETQEESSRVAHLIPGAKKSG